MKAQILAPRPTKLHSSLSNAGAGHATIGIARILAPTDFSPASEKALKYALRFAGEFGAEITLLHILEAMVPLTFEGLTMPLPATEMNSPETANILKTMVASARQQGAARARGIVRRGIASHEIVEVAKELDVDLIVMATHGYTGWKHFAIGSTAERVVRAAPCPVFVVREKEHDFV